ncbi:hypothetical protein pEaSNUABM42_00092 [Erwinia phage pEa_SNUABM_42]|nr:hypothetical protein pEaSNUABM43_00092 [Erwinia phage pEa_SNUABM_43]QVW55409.1 hypothetical protein pEaSNUABM42_00092 [Erwinia phage pEa_SNUABM_42]
MAISSSAVVKIIESRLAAGNDTTLTAINQAISERGISAQDALDIAIQIGDILLAKGVAQDKIVENIISAYKAAAYQLLQKAGIAFQSDPGLHERLNKFFQEVRAMIKASVQTSSGTLGGLVGTAIPGASLSVAPSAPVTSSPIGDLGGIQVGDGIPVTPAATSPGLSAVSAAPLEAFAETPAVAKAAAPQQPAPKVNPVSNAPVKQIIEVEDLETYAEHELSTPRTRVSISAKDANEKVNEFLTTGNWVEPLADLLAGKTNAVYYAGADILVRANRVTRRYLVNPTKDAEFETRIAEFTSQHESQLARLDDLYGMDDPEKIINAVTSVVQKMKENIVSFYTDMLREGAASEIVASEVARFTNVALGTMSIAVHNALSLGTNRCQSIPTNPKIELERNMDDLEFFSDILYQKTVGDNGYTTEPDFFRELFMMVASSLRKVNVRYGSGELIVRHEVAEIVIPGNYPTLKRNNVVGKHSLGATHDPVTTIFEEFVRNKPEVNVMLKADETYLLLSTGENTAPIYY